MASAKIVLKTGKTYKDDTHPIVLRVIHKQKQKTIALGITAKKEDWAFENSRYKEERIEGDKKVKVQGAKAKNKALNALDNRAEEILLQFDRENAPFCLELFESKFREKKSVIKSLFEMFEIWIDELDQKGKVGTRDVYKATFSIIKTFCNKKDVSLYSVDYEFLKKFETFLFNKGNTGGGVRNHLRNLRAVLNEAIRRKLFDANYYPFSTQFNKSGYSLGHLKSTAMPRALSKEDLEKFKHFNYEDYPNLRDAHNFFMFSYYARGMNFADMVYLTKSHIYDGRIPYFRRKNGKLINIKNGEHLQKIIDYYWDDSKEYIFPILSDFHQTPQQKADRIKKCLKKYNKDLKEIAEILKIRVKITSYVARHSYATTLRRNGTSSDKISELLAHSNLKVVKHYLEKFENEELDQTDELL